MKICAGCGIAIDAHGRQKFCPPCGVINNREMARLGAERQRRLHPEQSRARQKRFRERHAEELRASRRTPEYRERRKGVHDRERFGGLRQDVLDRDDHRCRVCGATNDTGFRNLPIHHIDGDPTHNVMENLITLCRVCHPHYHNRWNDRIMDELRALIA